MDFELPIVTEGLNFLCGLFVNIIIIIADFFTY